MNETFRVFTMSQGEKSGGNSTTPLVSLHVDVGNGYEPLSNVLVHHFMDVLIPFQTEWDPPMREAF